MQAWTDCICVLRELNVPLFNPEWYEKITTVVKVEPKKVKVWNKNFQKDEQSKTRENRQEELRDLFKDVSVEKK